MEEWKKFSKKAFGDRDLQKIRNVFQVMRVFSTFFDLLPACNRWDQNHNIPFLQFGFQPFEKVHISPVYEDTYIWNPTRGGACCCFFKTFAVSQFKSLHHRFDAVSWTNFKLYFGLVGDFTDVCKELYEYPHIRLPENASPEKSK